MQGGGGGPRSAAEPAKSECRAAEDAAVAACANADQLVVAARQATEDLRLARRQRVELAGEFELVRLGDRGALRAAKDEAVRVYRGDYERARDESALLVATATWLGDVSRLNVDARRAAAQGKTLAARQAELDALVERLELAAKSARIAAETAAEACVSARRTLAACQQAAGIASAATARPERVPPPPPPAQSADQESLSSLHRAQALPAPPPASNAEPAIMVVLSGDRARIEPIVPRLAEELGEDAGRLQLLLLDLREALIASANRSCVYEFPYGHPFWSQFSLAEARAFAAGLATLGRLYDGTAGWVGGQLPSQREMAMALSLGGRDPRSVRYQPSGADLERLWRGVSVSVTEHVAVSAPDLRLETMRRLAGEQVAALTELWRNWELLRPLLLAD